MTADEMTLLKFQLRIEPDFTGQDVLLTQCWDAAIAYVLTETRRTLAELTDDFTGTLKSDIRQAVLLLAAHFYNAPSATDAKSPSAVPYALDAILKPYTRLT